MTHPRPDAHAPRAPRGSRLATLAALAGLCLAAGFCKQRDIPEGECVFDSDCTENNQVCAGRYCRPRCNADADGGAGDRDCPAGWRCRRVPYGGRVVSACLPPTEPDYCVYHSQCEPPLVCNRDGRCASQCLTNYDCQAISLDPQATCDTSGGMGICSFRRDGGVPMTPTDAATPADSATRAD